MSQMTATARVASRAPQRRTAAPQPLRVVPARAGQPGSAMFAALCMLLLIGGLMGLLMLNTSMAEGSFTLHRLQATSGELTDTEQALTAAIDAQRGARPTSPPGPPSSAWSPPTPRPSSG